MHAHVLDSQRGCFTAPLSILFGILHCSPLAQAQTLYAVNPTTPPGGFRQMGDDASDKKDEHNATPGRAMEGVHRTAERAAATRRSAQKLRRVRRLRRMCGRVRASRVWL